MRRVGLALVAIALVAAGCTKSSAPQVRTVLVDNKANGFVGSFLAYYPNTLKVHAGDSIDFKAIWSGEPHTVTMGTVVEAGLAAAKGMSENAPPPPAVRKLPSLFPDGQGDLVQTAAQPCYLQTGDPSALKGNACAKLTQPAFDGKQAYYNSGILKKDTTFEVKLASDIASGTYHYYCNVHGPEMSGSFTVVGKDAKTSTADQVTSSAAAQFKKETDKLSASLAAARAGHAIVPGYLAGYGDPSVNSAIDEFVPSSINATVGQKITWTFIGFHTITFGAPANLSPFTFAPDGSVHIDPKAVGPQGGPGAQAGSGGKGISVKNTDAGTYDGTGVKSSGGTDSFPPNLASYSITFTKAGTYPYRCLVHPGMGGVVVVK